MPKFLEKIRRAESYDHPVVFIALVILVIIPVIALLNLGAKQVGWPGPTALMRAFSG